MTVASPVLLLSLLAPSGAWPADAAFGDADADTPPPTEAVAPADVDASAPPLLEAAAPAGRDDPVRSLLETAAPATPAAADAVPAARAASAPAHVRLAGPAGPRHALAADCEQADDRYCDEIERLAALAAVQHAFRHIADIDERTLREHIMLTGIPAPPFMEERRGAKYAEMLREAGADSVWIDEEGNVIGLRRGTGADADAGTAASGNATLAFSGHLDTVFPEGTDVTVAQRGDTLFAPGIGDDTRGIMVVLTVLRALEAAGIETAGDVLFIGTVGEEGLGDLRGVKHLFRDGGPRIDAFVSVDGGDDGRIVNRALGSRRYRITYEGPGGHSWGAFGTANPAHALGRAIQIFDDAAARYTADGDRTSYNIGRIGGGTSVNSIPFEAWMEVDMRSISPERLMEIDSIFRDVVHRALEAENVARRVGPALAVDVRLVGDRPSGEIAASNPLVQRAMAVVEHFGGEPRLARSSTDSNTPISLGIPAVTVSRGGDGEGAHSPEEWWRNEDGTRAIRQALLLVLAQAGIADAATE